MTRVAIYTRVSDREQGMHGFSLDSQLSACRSYAASQGWVESGAWTDVQTGLDESRPQYQAMLREMRSWDVVLVWRIDRLGRDAAEWFPLLKRLSAADRKVASATENVDDPFVLGILILLAQRESENTRRRVIQVMLDQARTGRHLGRPPLGYRMSAGQLLVDEAGAEQYREAVQRVLAGESLRSICRDWNQRGRRRRTGERTYQWWPGVLRATLANELHLGLVWRNGMEAPVRGVHQPLIDEPTWRQVQATLASRRQQPAVTGSSRHLLAGLLRCAACGGAMVYLRATPRKQADYLYLYCKRRQSGGQCAMARCHRPAPIEAIVERLLQPVLDLDVASILTRAAQLRDGRYDARLNQRREELAGEIERRERRLETLRDMLADGDITRAEYQTDRARHIEALGSARRALRSLPSGDAALADGLRGALGQVKDEWRRAPVDRKRALLRTLGLTITIGPAEAAISWAEPLNQILGGGMYGL